MHDPTTRLAYIKTIRDWLGMERARLAAAYLSLPQADRFLRGYTTLVDDVIRRIANDIGLPTDAALVAVGGYGRGYLFPSSDVDVLILLPASLADINTDPSSQSSIEAFVSLMWDVGLEPGTAVRTISECVDEAAKDVTVDTSVLEARFVWGSPQLVEQLSTALTKARDVPRFLAAKIDEQRRRHARHNDVALNLEPNIKESPGGLRDLQTVLWIWRASQLNKAIPTKSGHDWASLEENGLITAEEATLVAKHRRVLIDLRIRLHLLAGRREDRLVFDHQSALAEQLKLKPTHTKRASEVLMRRYYLSAKIIWQINSILLANLSERILQKNRDSVKKIDADFELVNGSIAAIDTNIFKRDPPAIFRAFLALQHTPEAEFFSAETLRALWREVPHIGPTYRADRTVNQLFLQILNSDRLTFSLRRMSRYGILGRFLPAFGRIVGQMQHDLFHVYTVDEHILMVLRNMRRLVLPRFAHEFPFCHSLAREFKGVHLLYLACLFHDIAKGRGGDHSALGMNDARRFSKQLGLPAEDGELVAWLVDMHLVMSSTAQKQDLGDPEVIAKFAAKVGTERRLVALYLLTVADIRGTSPHVWSTWKDRLLAELFESTLRLIRAGRVEQDSTSEQEINAQWLEFKRRDTLIKLDTDRPPAIWSVVNERYFQRFDVDDLCWHARTIQDDIAPDTARIYVKEVRGAKNEHLDECGELFEVLVMASDRSGLFARMTGAFEHMQLDIGSARIYTTENGYALDTFLVVPRSRQHRTSSDVLAQIKHNLTLAISKPAMLERNPSRLARQAKHFPLAPQISLQPASSGNRAFFELTVICADRPGLLSSLARTLHEQGVSVHDARVTTLGNRAEDVFVIEHKSLANPEFANNLKTKLAEIAG